MKIIKNEKLIKRNATIGKIASLVGLVVLAGGMYLSFKKPELFSWSLGALVLGFAMTQVSMYFGNRWGRHPRPDEQLDAALKGLPGEVTLYHYKSPVSHLLVGPVGVWILLPYHQKGKITYRNNRWKGSGGGFLQGYMRIFGQESLGRPDIEAGIEAASLEKFFKKNFGQDEAIPPIRAALVFLNPSIEIDAEGSPLPAMQVKKLKDFLRKAAKETPFSSTELARIKAVLPDE